MSRSPCRGAVSKAFRPRPGFVQVSSTAHRAVPVDGTERRDWHMVTVMARPVVVRKFGEGTFHLGLPLAVIEG